MLHGPFGIGVIGKEAMEFIDFLSNADFHVWQVLPVEHTDLCASPYKCVSAFAGEPMLIDPRMLLEMGLITQDELSERTAGVSDNQVDYELVRKKQWIILQKAFERLDGKPYSDFNPFWLENYALYMAIKYLFAGEPWYEWPDKDLRSFDKDALKRAAEDLSDIVDFHKFVQWLFHVQWTKLKEYATEHDVSIIGDMPIYVSEDSAEVWSKRSLFDADSEGNFLAVGGAPPDYFNPDGQLWGNPAYNWDLMRDDGYEWWVNRVRSALGRYDMIRLDHFRGYESYWRIPVEAASAREGMWAKGPGIPFFRTLEQELGNLPIIAEDLGVIDEDVEALLMESGYRGMRVLQFGFLGDARHLPYNYSENCIAYTGTHDNTTLLAWLFELAPADREQALLYLGFDGDWTTGGPNSEIIRAWIRALYMSAASLVIIPIQDLLGYGADTRTNIPGRPKGNWRFRIHPDALRQIDAGYYATLNRQFSRCNVAIM